MTSAEEHFFRKEDLPTAGHALSGALSSALGNLLIYPLNTVSTRLKVQRHAMALRNDEELYESHFDAFRKIYEREGIAGFYHGAGWDTAGHVVNGFWYFMAYTALRKQRLYILGHRTKTALPVMEELTLGIAAAALSGLASAPFSNIVTRKQTHAILYPGAKHPSFADIFHDIMREKGITGFWSGYAASLLLTFNPSITFLLYEAVKPHAVLHKGADLDKFDIFMLAAACKAAATTLMYPLNIVRIRSQMEDGSEEWEGMIEATTSTKGIHISKGKHHSKGSSSQYRRTIRQASGIVEMMSEIVKREGFGALYVGLGGTLFKGFFTHGVNMMIKEQVHRFVLRLYFFVL
ncbi:mitochondrial carrier domain-containing protein, partial [Sphaerosporella brunnea]